MALQSQADQLPGATPTVKQVLNEVISLLDQAIGTLSPGHNMESIQQDAKRFMEQTVEGIHSWGEAGRDIGQAAADYLDANSTLRTAFEAAGEGIGIAIGVGINAAGMSRGKAGGKAPKVGKINSSQSTHPRLNTVNNRRPINSEYAGKVYPLERLPEELRQKYPHSVPFTGTGHPDFSRYAQKKVKIQMTGKNLDFILADKAAGFSKRPAGYTWHHHHDGETMLLVPKDIHRAVNHTGGVAIIKSKK